MAYNLNQMYDFMDIAVKDEDGRLFTDALKTKWLNTAQDHIISLINSQYIVELHTVDAGESPTTGVYAMSGLTYSVYRKHLGLMGVRVASGVFCDFIDFEQYKQYVTDGYTFVATAPKYYVRGSSIYLFPTSISSIDVYYVRVPAVMTENVASGSIANGTVYTVNDYTTVKYPSTTGTNYTDGQSFTGSTGDGTTYDVTGTGTVTIDCELEDDIQEAILDYSKGMARHEASDYAGAERDMAIAYQKVEVFNRKIDAAYQSYSDSSRTAYQQYRRDPIAAGGDR